MRFSRILPAALACALLPLMASAQDTTVLRGARLIDGSANAPLDNAVLVIRDGRIAAVGAAESVDLPADATVIDYRGKTLMPGLISTHSHVGIASGLEVGPEQHTRENILRQLRQYTAYGVTTVTALGLNGAVFYDVRAAVHSGREPGADLFGADRGIGVPDGAPPASALPLGPDQVYRTQNVAAAREAIREMAARKTDLVKLWLDGFGGTAPKLDPDVYRAAIEEAHAQGLRVAVHIHDLDDAKAVVRAGADIIAHGVRDRPVDEEFIALLKQNDVWYVPTLALDEATFIYAEQPAWMQTEFFANAVHPEVRARMADPEWQRTTLEDPRAAAARRALATNQRNLKTLHEAGVKIAFGTDSGANPFRIPGVAEHRELALMVEAGLTPLEAIRIATANSAALLELEDRGRLAPGLSADLVVLDGDPTADIAASTRIVGVWHRGRPVERERFGH